MSPQEKMFGGAAQKLYDEYTCGREVKMCKKCSSKHVISETNVKNRPNLQIICEEKRFILSNSKDRYYVGCNDYISYTREEEDNIISIGWDNTGVFRWLLYNKREVFIDIHRLVHADKIYQDKYIPPKVAYEKEEKKYSIEILIGEERLTIKDIQGRRSLLTEELRGSLPIDIVNIISSYAYPRIDTMWLDKLMATPPPSHESIFREIDLI